MGGARGRLIPAEDRLKAVTLIDEAVKNRARCGKACDVLRISVRTYQRWKNKPEGDKRKGAEKKVLRKLTDQEKKEIVDMATGDRFKDCNPHEIVAILLEERKYIASASTFYRVLRSENLINHRANTRPGKKHVAPPELVATGPNQIWAWDITYLPSAVYGLFYYAYTIIDIWDRSIVGWEIYPNESQDHSSDLFKRMKIKYKIRGIKLHSDNGSPMKGSTMLMTLHKMGVIPSFSRPRVSNDNAFIESFFKTLKYTTGYPKCFTSLQHAREWFADFINWYNTEHRHSGIGYITPHQKRTGEGARIMKTRNETLQAAKEKHPERWSQPPKVWSHGEVVILNKQANKKQDSQESVA